MKIQVNMPKLLGGGKISKAPLGGESEKIVNLTEEVDTRGIIE